MTLIVTFLLLPLFIALFKWQWWKNKSLLAEEHLKNVRSSIKKRNFFAVDLDLATTTQIFEELSKRGRIILLIPHRENDVTFVETLSAQLSPVQTMDVLRVAYTGIAGHLGSEEEE